MFSIIMVCVGFTFGGVATLRTTSASIVAIRDINGGDAFGHRHIRPYNLVSNISLKTTLGGFLKTFPNLVSDLTMCQCLWIILFNSDLISEYLVTVKRETVLCPVGLGWRACSC